MSRTSTSSMVTAKGKAPMNMSARETSGSLMVLLMTKQEMPRGGVNRPISAPTTVTMPNQTKSMPKASNADRNKGTTIKMIDAVSRIVPNISIKIT